MIEKLSQVTLYMNDLETAKEFWVQKVGFHLFEDVEVNGVRRIEIAPTEQAETKFALLDKHVMAQISPEVSLDTPSLLFQTANIHSFYNYLKSKNVKVGDLVTAPFRTMFNFSDDEQNYFFIHQVEN